MSFNLPNPSLVGILLVVSTVSGPSIVFNYPQDLSGQEKSSQETHIYQEEEENSDGEYSDDDDGDLVHRKLRKQWDSTHLNFYTGTKGDLLSYLDELYTQRQSHEKRQNTSMAIPHDMHDENQSKKRNKSKTNLIFGMETTYLGEMLSPPKSMCNTRFEMQIDDKVFLGMPIHKLDNNSWRRKEKHRAPTDQKSTLTDLSDNRSHRRGNSLPKADVEVVGEDTSIQEKEHPTGRINMFHLVFIMNPPINEANQRVDEMFHFVISRLSLVLRYEQSRNGYVSKEIKSIFKLKETQPDTWWEACYEQSGLCKMIGDCYTAISTSQIANLSINNKLRSFQIPIKWEFVSLPEPSVPHLPGAKLCSTTKFLANEGLLVLGEPTRYGSSSKHDRQEGDDTGLVADDVIYFALLLLDDPRDIIRELKADEASSLAKFIHLIKPTESLSSLAQASDLNMDEIKSYAFHLIYWRRARVIQPISTRSVYVLSPMAPLSVNLFYDIKNFRNSFPTLPSMSHFLKLLSPHHRKPSHYASIIPSRDHKESYFQALTWLLKFGYVIQLQTFVWLKVSPIIRMKVDEDMEEGRGRKTKPSSSGDALLNQSSDNTSKVQPEVTTTKQDIDSIQEKLTRGTKIELDEDEDYIIMDPGRATTLERRWMSKIISDEAKLAPELVPVFYKMVKYFNGKSPLDVVIHKENVSKAELRNLLTALEPHLISVSHW
ncbi:hypothetical protein DIURU_005523 [Diutina rugosa]|uniref:Nitrogen permease regulator 3 n=1 Tax=Diutina rugosa TaxID=5481 RepID=A0A642UHB7_DIURU|nr:uncharacterized protein DIURU_005523 [Diutina rugosa]KAA8897010.1 hypothetical protein DIURU_005523 [Diutina rugosa]